MNFLIIDDIIKNALIEDGAFDDITTNSILNGNEQLFASKYKLYLPTKEELRREIERQKEIFYLQKNEN